MLFFNNSEAANLRKTIEALEDSLALRQRLTALDHERFHTRVMELEGKCQALEKQLDAERERVKQYQTKEKAGGAGGGGKYFQKKMMEGETLTMRVTVHGAPIEAKKDGFKVGDLVRLKNYPLKGVIEGIDANGILIRTKISTHPYWFAASQIELIEGEA